MTLYERAELRRELEKLPLRVLIRLADRLDEFMSRRRRGVPGRLEDLPPRLRGVVRRTFPCEVYDKRTGRRCGA